MYFPQMPNDIEEVCQPGQLNSSTAQPLASQGKSYTHLAVPLKSYSRHCFKIHYYSPGGGESCFAIEGVVWHYLFHLPSTHIHMAGKWKHTHRALTNDMKIHRKLHALF